MRIAAVTVVYNESIFLEKWLEYYSSFVDTIHIINHQSTDGSIEKARKKFDFSLGSMEGVHYDVGVGQETTNHIKKSVEDLSKSHDFVISPDVDEFIFPGKYKSLREYIKKLKTDVATCTGYDVVHTKGEKHIDWNKPLLEQRKHWIKKPLLCKTIITKTVLDWIPGRHYTFDAKREHPDIEEYLLRIADPDLILAHLRDIDSFLLRGSPVKQVPRENSSLEVIPKEFKII